MKTPNLPVPAYAPAPVSLRWFLAIAPPAGLTFAYRAIPPVTRGLWNRDKATSHTALSRILAGGGWAAFFGGIREWWE